MSQSAANTPARVYLVGAGPGDPGLITLRGAEYLRRADVVLYDYLVNPRLLTHAAADAKLICLGRHGQGHGRILSQDEIHEQMAHHARLGLTVVRLKGGDPAVFARGAQEGEFLAAEGIPFEIVPGITVALAAGSYAGIPITHRDHASAVALVTGQQHDGESLDLDFRSLATFPGTLVFYMGTTTAREWTSRLIDQGKSPDTPAAIVRRCSLSDQQTIDCTLATVAETIADQHIRPPAIVIIGPVVRLGSTLQWFSHRPLFGRRIVVTRSREQAGRMCDRLTELGADVLLQPVIEIRPPEDFSPVDRALGQLAQYDWLVFSSANGVRYLLDRLLAIGLDLRRLGNLRLAAIGPGTAAELGKYHLIADCIPQSYRAEALAAMLLPQASGQRFLLARASRGREVLAEQLTAAGGDVDQIVVYQSTDVVQPQPEVNEAIAAGTVDIITVTSSAIARSLVAMFGEALRKTNLVSISPLTSQALRELGHEPSVEAADYTIDGVIQAIERREA